MHESVNANAGTARVMHPVGNGRLIPRVLRILILPILVMHIMGGTFGAMMMPVPATTAGRTGIATETGTETGTGTEKGTGTGIGDTTDETPGHPGTTTVQTAPPQLEEAMVPETVTGAVVTTTEEKETGNERGVGTVTNHDPEIANMTDDLLPRSTVPHHHPRAVTIIMNLILLLADLRRRIHLGQGARLLLEPADTHPPRDIPRPPKSPSPRGASPSPKQYPRPAPSPARSDLERRSVETAGRQLHTVEPQTEGGVVPIKVEEQPVEGAIIMEGQTEVEMTTEPPIIKGEDRSDQPDEELHGQAELIRRTSSPTECQQQQSLPSHETVAAPPSEVAVTQPYLPTIPRYNAKPRFSAAYESEASHSDSGCADGWLTMRFFLVQPGGSTSRTCRSRMPTVL
ncbi:hypothetical protein JVT61DRAFT_11560 [Boletus reticuloceps]|uniref:Uncharacterized protein n=1 Tax=Boletus reticuloceps TaxID=495285 RepID=A0A8I2YY49_9AGAM|nr:hypothetical protein JVT61DRAFT_11560 [Boletus reticuloceps]